MANEITIPILPCRSINETLEFYVALGFEITYQQSRPNTYGCVRRGDIDLHFFTLKDYVPANSYSSCLVLMPDIDGLYQDFAAGLRQHYGKLPVAGIPRITKPNNNNSVGDRRFNVIDPGGNWIRFIERVGEEVGENVGEKIKTPEGDEQSAGAKAVSTKLARAINAADLLANSKGDYAAAAKMLDAALAHDEPVRATERVQALVARAGLALNMDDRSLAASLLDDARQISLDDTERAALTVELEQAADLGRMLQ